MTHIALHSLLLEQTFGFYFLIIAIIMVARAGYFRQLINNLNSDSPLIMVMSSFALLIGIAMVIVHNLWFWRFELIITIIAWLIVIKSILWLSIPDKMTRYSRALYNSPFYFVMAAIIAIFGILLLAHGFYLSM